MNSGIKDGIAFVDGEHDVTQAVIEQPVATFDRYQFIAFRGKMIYSACGATPKQLAPMKAKLLKDLNEGIELPLPATGFSLVDNGIGQFSGNHIYLYTPIDMLIIG